MELEPSTAGNILVVDDTVENLHLLSSMLEQEGFDVRPVPSGPLALQAVDAELPDLILLDINMTPLDGYDVCVRLKENPHTRGVPVIFVSALDETLDKVKAFEAGGVDYVTKPYQMAEVLARVRTHLQLRRTQLQLEASHAQLRQLEALRDDLVHMVVHDLRSPLSALIYSLGFMREALAAQASSEFLGDIDAAAVAASTMVGMANDLLDVSRIESNHLPLHLDQEDLLEVVKTAVESVRRLQPERDVSIEAEGPMFARIDAAIIRRVVENLVANGLKHTPAQFPLRVEVSHYSPQADTNEGGAAGAGEFLRVSVSDRGEGVPEEYREKIFEKFGVSAARNAHAYHSVGLGLAFCKLAVEAHGGRIGVDSSAGGSSFWFVVPVG